MSSDVDNNHVTTRMSVGTLAGEQVERERFCQLVGLIAEHLETLGRYETIHEPEVTQDTPQPGLSIVHQLVASGQVPHQAYVDGEREAGRVGQRIMVLEFPSHHHSPTENEEPVRLMVAVQGYDLKRGQYFDWHSLIHDGVVRSHDRLRLGVESVTWADIGLERLIEWNAQLLTQYQELAVEYRRQDVKRVSNRYRQISEQLDESTNPHPDDRHLHLLEMLAPALEELLSRPYDEKARRSFSRSLLRIQMDLNEAG